MLRWLRHVWVQITEPLPPLDVWDRLAAPSETPSTTSAATAPASEPPQVVPVQPTPPARRSVWEEIAEDPGAAALRARWEARWDEF
jgi:hypothetical protein